MLADFFNLGINRAYVLAVSLVYVGISKSYADFTGADSEVLYDIYKTVDNMYQGLAFRDQVLVTLTNMLGVINDRMVLLEEFDFYHINTNGVNADAVVTYDPVVDASIQDLADLLEEKADKIIEAIVGSSGVYTNMPFMIDPFLQYTSDISEFEYYLYWLTGGKWDLGYAETEELFWLYLDWGPQQWHKFDIFARLDDSQFGPEDEELLDYFDNLYGSFPNSLNLGFRNYHDELAKPYYALYGTKGIFEFLTNSLTQNVGGFDVNEAITISESGDDVSFSPRFKGIVSNLVTSASPMFNTNGLTGINLSVSTNALTPVSNLDISRIWKDTYDERQSLDSTLEAEAVTGINQVLGDVPTVLSESFQLGGGRPVITVASFHGTSFSIDRHEIEFADFTTSTRPYVLWLVGLGKIAIAIYFAQRIWYDTIRFMVFHDPR